MREIIKKIFYDNDFKVLKLEDPFEENQVEFFANYSKDAVNFYLTVFVEDIKEDFLSEHVPLYFNAIKKLESGYDERMDKNLSMVVCVNTDSITDQKITEKVFEIEEDPYFFKKYVIAYNEYHYTELKRQFDIGTESSTVLLNKIANDTEKFLNYKKGEINNDSILYEICTKLMIKIPFLILEKRNGKIEDLSEEINKELVSDELIEFNEILLKVNENDEKLVENILATMDGDNNE